MRITLQKLMLVLALAIGQAPIVWAAASGPAPGSITIQPSGITYYAQAGDTLMSIAQRLTTKTGNWVALGTINRVSKDSNIPIGTGIIIPTELLADEPTEATVIARNGNITATAADGRVMTIDIGSRVAEGMRITTGSNSFLTLSLADQSRISVPSNSNVLIAKLRKSLYTASPRTEVKLLRGRVVSRVSPLDTNKGRFEVRTPASVAGVRGTHFRVGFDGNKVATEVLDGHVAVGSQAKPDTRMLDSVKGNIITASAIGQPVDLLPAPQLASMPYRQNGNAQFAVAPVKGARAYHIQLAQDSETLHLLAEAKSTTQEVVIDNIQEGNYFAQISAIDALGLEGMPRTLAVTIKNRTEPLKEAPLQPAPSVSNSYSKELELRWVGSASQKYNIQVARDLEFTWLMYNSNVTGNEIKLPRPGFGTYFTRVQSVNADGSTNPFSSAQPLIVTDQWIINDGHPLRSKEAARESSRTADRQ
ncbi:FecR protein [compost metagenome]